MRRIILVVLVTIIVFLTSGCQGDLDITPDIIDVQFENIRWEEDILVSDIHITNGTSEAQYIDYMEFALYLPDGVTEFCGAGYDILSTVKANRYISYEIEFTSEFINMTKTQFEALDISLEELEMHFWYNE